MKMNEVKNKKVVSALMIGISAMMALQTPITAYANDNNSDTPSTDTSSEDTGATQEQTVESTDSFDQDMGNAMDAADEAQSACVAETGSWEVEVPQASAPSETQADQTESNETASPQTITVASAKTEVTEAADIILNGDTDSATPVPAASTNEVFLANTDSNEEVKDLVNDLVDTAKEIVTDGTTTSVNENGESVTTVDPSAVTSLENANTHIADAKQNLEDAKEANTSASAAYSDMYVDKTDENGNVVQNPYDESVAAFKVAIDQMQGTAGIISMTSNIEGTISDIEKQASELLDAIENAKTADDANLKKESLDELIKETVQDLSAKVTVLQQLVDRYEQAANTLSDAQERFSAAQEKLESADTLTHNELKDALADVNEAKADVEAASKKVDNLADALSDVMEKLPDLEEDSSDLVTTRANWNNAFGNSNYKLSREVMKDVIVGYYIPEILGINIIQDSVTFGDPDKLKTNNYEERYTSVTYSYLDSNGDTQTETRYFNWDSIAKTDRNNENNNSNKCEAAKDGIVIYEKCSDEVNPKTKAEVEKDISDIAMARIQAIVDSGNTDYFLNYNNLLFIGTYNGKSLDNVKKANSQNMFNLYSYTDDEGVTQYITQVELFGRYPGEPGVTLDAKYKVANLCEKTNKGGFDSYTDEDGVTWYVTYDGVKYRNLQKEEYKAVTQNKNGLYGEYHNCLIIGDQETIEKALTDDSEFVKQNVVDRYNISDEVINKMIEDNKKLNNFITANSSANAQKLLKQYSAYEEEVKQAQAAVDNAENQVQNITNAITTVQNSSNRKTKTQLAKDILNTSGDSNFTIAGYLGLTVTEEKSAALDKMTMAELIEELSNLKKAAKDQLSAAQVELDDADNKKETAQQKLDAVLEKIAQEQTASGGGGETTVETASTGGAGGGATITPATSVTDPFTSPTITVTAATPAPAATNIADTAVPTAPTAPAPATTAINVPAGGADIGGLNADNATGVQAEDTGNTVEIVDEDTARTDTPEVIADEGNVETQEDAYTILEEDAAKASTFEVPATEKKMSWWWIIIVTLLGVTGEEMYRRHLIAAAKREKDEEKDENNTTL